MIRFATGFRALLTLSIVLTGVSASQAGLFAVAHTLLLRSGGRFHAARSSVPAAAQPAVSTNGPTVYTAAKPVIGETVGGAAASAPQSGTYCAGNKRFTGGGWSTLPRSSWDFGKFPPYSN